MRSNCLGDKYAIHKLNGQIVNMATNLPEETK